MTPSDKQQHLIAWNLWSRTVPGFADLPYYVRRLSGEAYLWGVDGESNRLLAPFLFRFSHADMDFFVESYNAGAESIANRETA